MSATTSKTALQLALLLANPDLSPLQLATSVGLAGVGEALQRHAECFGFDDNSDVDVQGFGEFLSCFVGNPEPLDLSGDCTHEELAEGFASLVGRALAQLHPAYLDALSELVAPASPQVEN